MKAILISIRPQWVAMILNGEKTIEIRKKFPKDYVGWVYIYCTKTRPYITRGVRGDVYPSCVSSQGIVPHHLNSRVVARFWCDKVEKIEHRLLERHYTETLDDNELLDKSCLSHEELHNYLRTNIGYAIYLTKLEIFDKPKELNNYLVPSYKVSGIGFKGEKKTFTILKTLTKAPQSWCYVEV